MSGASSAPAPTAYNISNRFGNEHRDFNRTKYSSMFQKPIAERPLSSKSSLPAPNQYDVNNFVFLFFLIKFLFIIKGTKRIKKNNKIK
jgi:hypothetical protein